MQNTLLKIPRALVLVMMFSLIGIAARATTTLTDREHGNHNLFDVQVSGHITDENGSAMPGVNVIEKGTTNGTTSNADGDFTIKVQDGTSILVFSFIGYAQQEFIVGNNTIVNIKLIPDIRSLEEVVVVAYGEVKKSDITGSVASIRGDDLARTTPISINQSLQGQLAGVMVNRNDGAPGAGISIQIRGANSFGSSTEPLFVIDGIPFVSGGTPSAPDQDGVSRQSQTINPLSFMNPQDIESITVLKDASATAIYGVRAANGVVIVTTKKGKNGQDKIEFTTNLSIAKISKKINVLNGYDYANFMNEASANLSTYEGAPVGAPPYPAVGETHVDKITGLPHYYPSPSDFKNGYLNGGTNWQDQIFQNALTQEYSLRVSGGSDKGSYAISGNMLDQQGIIVNSGYKRYGVQASVNRKVHDWIEIGANLNITRSNFKLSKTNGDGDAPSIISSTIQFPSTLPVFDSTSASKFSQVDLIAANPWLYARTAKDETHSTNLYTAGFIRLKFTDYLSFRQNLGSNYSYGQRDVYYNRYLGEGKSPTNGYGSIGDNLFSNVLSESLLSFDKTYNNHVISAVAGYTYETGGSTYKRLFASNFPFDITQEYKLSSGLNQGTPDNGKDSYTLMSYLARVNYSYKDKYLLTASWRRDGSSHFAAAHKWASFPSFAVGWKLSQESFIQSLNAFSNLKLRFSYGLTGNQSIAPYSTIDQLGGANTAINGTKQSGVAALIKVNPNLYWEDTRQTNLGIDAGFFNNRLNITVDVYDKKTRNLLQNVQTPVSSGFPFWTVNGGNIENKGLEISAQLAVIDKGDFTWNVNGNITFNRNRISGLAADQFANRLWSGIDNLFIQRNGQPIGTIYGYVEDGFYDNEAEVRADPQYANQSDKAIRAKIGEIKYKNFDDDATSIGANDRKIIGNVNPSYIFGLTNNFNYKNFSLSVFIQGVQGNDLLNGNLINNRMGPFGNITQQSYDTRWTPENTTNAKWPRPTAGYARAYKLSDRYIEDGSYIRLKNVNLGYTFHSPIKQIELLNIYVSGNNLLLRTKYSWYDPDVNSFASDPSRRGVDTNSYPNTRTYTIGLKATF